MGEAAGTASVEQTAQFELPLPLVVVQKAQRVAHDFAGVVAPAGLTWESMNSSKCSPTAKLRGMRAAFLSFMIMLA